MYADICDGRMLPQVLKGRPTNQVTGAMEFPKKNFKLTRDRLNKYDDGSGEVYDKRLVKK